MGLTVALSTLLLATVTQDSSVGLKPELQLLNRQAETFKKDPSSPLPDFFPNEIAIFRIAKKCLKRVEIGRI